MHTQKTIGRYAAFKECPQLPFDKARDRAFPFPLSGQKGLQILRDDSIKGIFLGIAGTIFRSCIANEETLLLCLRTVIVE